MSAKDLTKRYTRTKNQSFTLTLIKQPKERAIAFMQLHHLYVSHTSFTLAKKKVLAKSADEKNRRKTRRLLETIFK